MNNRLKYIQDQVDYLQRELVPSGVSLGFRHDGLTGTGIIDVDGPLGLSVVITASPGYMSSDLAPVASVYRYGTLSLGASTGWLRRVNVTHNPHLFIPLEPMLTQLGYAFEDGVTANILELQHAPI